MQMLGERKHWKNFKLRDLRARDAVVDSVNARIEECCLT